MRPDRERAMRILHVVHQFMPEKVGGTELYTQSVMRQQAAAGYEVTLFTPSSGVSDLTFDDETGVQVARAAAGQRTSREVFTSTFRHSALVAQFTAVLDRVQPQIVHVQHLMGLPQQLIELLVARRIPYVVTLHDFWWVCANAQLITNYDETICEGPRAFLNCGRCALARAGLPQVLPVVPLLALPLARRNALLRRSLAQAARVLTLSEFVRRWHVAHGVAAEKIGVLPAGLDVPEGWQKLSVVAQDGEEKRPLRVAYVGGLAWQKGVHLLVEAMAGLNGTLEVVGDLAAEPEYVAQLRKLAGANVRFVGRLGRTAVFDFLASVDVVVVPSVWYETFCFVVSEAFVAGTPVVAARIGALADRVQHEQNGLLFEPGSAADLRAQLSRLLHEKGLLHQLQERMPMIPTMATHTADLLSTYETVVAEAGLAK